MWRPRYADLGGTDFYHGDASGMVALQAGHSHMMGGAWDGRMAIVVSSEVAQATLSKASLLALLAVAILVGAGAPLRIEPEFSCSMRHGWDAISPIAKNQRNAVALDPVLAVGYNAQQMRECEEDLLLRIGAASSTATADRVVFCRAGGEPSTSLQATRGRSSTAVQQGLWRGRPSRAEGRCLAGVSRPLSAGSSSAAALIGLASALPGRRP